MFEDAALGCVPAIWKQIWGKRRESNLMTTFFVICDFLTSAAARGLRTGSCRTSMIDRLRSKNFKLSCQRTQADGRVFYWFIVIMRVIGNPYSAEVPLVGSLVSLMANESLFDSAVDKRQLMEQCVRPEDINEDNVVSWIPEIQEGQVRAVSLVRINNGTFVAPVYHTETSPYLPMARRSYKILLLKQINIENVYAYDFGRYEFRRDSWFPGYKWENVYCIGDGDQFQDFAEGGHGELSLGWRFSPATPGVRNEHFYGVIVDYNPEDEVRRVEDFSAPNWRANFSTLVPARSQSLKVVSGSSDNIAELPAGVSKGLFRQVMKGLIGNITTSEGRATACKIIIANAAEAEEHLHIKDLGISLGAVGSSVFDVGAEGLFRRTFAQDGACIVDPDSFEMTHANVHVKSPKQSAYILAGYHTRHAEAVDISLRFVVATRSADGAVHVFTPAMTKRGECMKVAD